LLRKKSPERMHTIARTQRGEYNVVLREHRGACFICTFDASAQGAGEQGDGATRPTFARTREYGDGALEVYERTLVAANRERRCVHTRRAIECIFERVGESVGACRRGCDEVVAIEGCGVA
jgi:hypothetical protein